MNEPIRPAGRPAGRLSRRRVLTLGAFAVAGTVAGLPLARALGARRIVRRSLPVMGTLAEVAVVVDGALDEAAAHEAVDAAFARLVAVDRGMSRYRADSDVGRLNAAAPGTTVRVGAATAHVLAASVAWAERSGGRFDPCLGALTEGWDVTARRTPLAPEELTALRAQAAGWTALERGSDPTAWALTAPARVDLGGIAKGFAVDEAVRALREHGVERAFVNAGGDLFALGTSEDGDPWRVGVRDPEDPSGQRTVATLQVRDGAVATSGDYERGFDFGGRRYHHILDPRTGAPRKTPRHSRTCEAATCLDADAAATATFGCSPTELAQLERGLGSLARVVG